MTQGVKRIAAIRQRRFVAGAADVATAGVTGGPGAQDGTYTR